jgi:hypothetical protein
LEILLEKVILKEIFSIILLKIFTMINEQQAIQKTNSLFHHETKFQIKIILFLEKDLN